MPDPPSTPRLRHLPRAAVAVRPHPARPRQRRQAHRRADPEDLPPRLWQRHARRPGRPGDRPPELGDNGRQRLAGPRIAFTTDSFVVRPLFFPGGDIGKLAVHGTVNDLAVGGATPLFLSAAFILEEGLPLADLKRIVASMRQACDEAGVALVTGDTKVVDRGKGDQVFITTSGIGVVPEGRSLSIRNARPGDKILVSGTIGDHGIAIMSVREGIEFETVLESDSAPLNDLTARHARSLPVDPLHARPDARRRLQRAQRTGRRLERRRAAQRIGAAAAAGSESRVRDARARSAVRRQRRKADRGRAGRGRRDGCWRRCAAIRSAATRRSSARSSTTIAGMVVMRSLVGGERVVTMLAGEQLPRIC